MIKLKSILFEEENKQDKVEISRDVAENMAAKFNAWQFDIEQLRKGMEVEMEHLNTIRKLPQLSTMEALALIALDHLKELPDYYSRLEKMEAEKSESPR